MNSYTKDKLLSHEIRNEKGFLTERNYHLYFPNPRGPENRRLIHLELDEFYRPKNLDEKAGMFAPENLEVRERK